MIAKVFWISRAYIITHTHTYNHTHIHVQVKTAVFYMHQFLGNEVIVVFVTEYVLVL